MSDEDFVEKRTGERRSGVHYCLTEDGMEKLADIAADKAVAKLGKLASMQIKLFIAIGAGFIAVFNWLQDKGLIGK